LRIAITLCAPSMDAQVDHRFGRARYMGLVDTDANEEEVWENPHIDERSAGVRAAKALADAGAQALISGEVGPNALKVLRAAGIRVYRARGSARDAVHALLSGGLDEVE